MGKQTGRLICTWVKGRNWFDDSESIWCSLIKTTRTEQQTYWAEVWVPCSYPPVDPIESTPLQNKRNTSSAYKNPDPDCGHWEYRQCTRYVSVNYPSDGLLPLYSQELQGVSSGNRYYISGANHIEVRDMSNSTLNGQPNDATRAKFNEIFDRGDWFRTPRKP